MKSKHLCIAILLWAIVAAAPAQEKRALVIGNGEYQFVAKLRNPANDAADMAKALERQGFKVELLVNSSLGAMEEAVVRLGNDLARASGSYGLFFYAGHGVQSNGSNYLIPIDADIKSEVFLKTKTLQVQSVLDTLQQARNGLNVVVLDACRDNPFGWSRGGTRGLSVVGVQPPGSIIVYATSAGAVAQDGEGRNGMFTGQLLKNLASGGLEVSELFRKTCADVVEESARKQIPAIYSQFFGTAYLSGGPATAAAPAPAIAAAPAAAGATPAPRNGEVHFSMNSAGLLEFGTVKTAVQARSSLSLKNIEPGSYTAVMKYPDGGTELRNITVSAGSQNHVPFIYTPVKKKENLVLADFASSFLGFSPFNTVEEIVEVLGTPTKINDNSSKNYTFDSYYWEIGADRVTAYIDRKSRKVSSMVIEKGYGENLLARFLQEKGIRDPRAEFIGSNKKDILKQFGKPKSHDSDNYEYEISYEGKTVLIKFICYDFNEYMCSSVDVHWVNWNR